MSKKIRKRSGNQEPYSYEKILNGIEKAFKACGYKKADYSYDGGVNIKEEYFEKLFDVEEIRNKVEDILMNSKYKDVAKAYILYRNKRKEIKEYVKEKQEFINRYKKSSNTANATVDDNSNVGNKNVAVLNAEIHKSDNIQISRGMVTAKLKELFPDFDSKQYVKDLEHHIIYKHDESSFGGAIAPYCVSISMYPFLLNGIKGLGGLSAAPKNLDSYCGMFCNLVFAISSQFAGAVACPEALLYFDYFARKEWGDDYYLRPDEIIGQSRIKTKTIQKQIHQHFQQIVYTINQTASGRNGQCPFTNFCYYDKPFFESMFENFVFPDMTKPQWESLNWLQKDFMKWFNAERLRCMMTFPVESFALIYKDGKFVDEENAEFVAQEWAEGHSFFLYISDTADSLSSCCFEGDEVIKVYEDDFEYNISLRDFVNSLNENVNPEGVDISSKNINIKSFDDDGNSKITKIVSILKKLYSGNLYEFNVGTKRIKVTEDHPMLVKDISDGVVKTLPAKTVYENKDKYLIAVE